MTTSRAFTGRAVGVGNLHLTKLPVSPPDLFHRLVRFGLPQAGLQPEALAWRYRNWQRLVKPFFRLMAAERLGVAFRFGELHLTKIYGSGLIVPYGMAGLRVVTTTGVGFIVDAWQNLVELEIMRYHGIGTGGAAEGAGNTALTTELTTEYTGDVRATGSLTEGASANIFRTVGTNTLDSGTPAITEHGIFSQAATGGGVLVDRTLFSAINLNGANGDGLQSTYDHTQVAGS